MCEFCPGDGSECAMCLVASETVEEPTPAHLRRYGASGRVGGQSLAQTLHLSLQRYGLAEAWQLAAVIEGYQLECSTRAAT